MGYYSEVAFKFELNEASDLELVINDLKNWMTEHEEANMISYEDDIRTNKDTGELWISFSSVKWYESFHDVQTLTEWYKRLSSLAEEFEAGETLLRTNPNEDFEPDEELIEDPLYNKIRSTQYIRIGEDYDDIDEDYNGDVYEYMYVSRSIEL